MCGPGLDDGQPAAGEDVSYPFLGTGDAAVAPVVELLDDLQVSIHEGRPHASTVSSVKPR